MAKLAQFGMAFGLLGLIVAFIGLFPGSVGLEQLPGVGVLQILVILVGFAMMVTGAYIFVQANFYPGIPHNLAQQIAIRLSMTGVVVATAAGLADVLGFGSHQPAVGSQRPFTGPVQAFGLLGGFIVASLGVVIFTVMGSTDDGDGEDHDEDDA